MEYYNRNDEIISQESSLNELLTGLYSSRAGRSLIRCFSNRCISEAVGAFMNTGLSTCLIKSFIKNAQIDMTVYENRKFKSYNDFFTRRIRLGARSMSRIKEDLCSPCDGKLSVYNINNDLKLNIKNSEYTLESLLRNKKLAKRYDNGLALVYRLSVDNYHRYSYIDNALKSKNFHISGKYYSVDPVALENGDVFKENTREYTLLQTQNFGTVLHMEVGATCVGKINNFHEEAIVRRGEEKGYFEFGGSTIIQFFESDKIKVLDKYKQRSLESEVYLGDIVGYKK